MPHIQNFRKHIFLILTICWICVIFSFSLQNGTLSSLQSGFFSTRIHQFLISVSINIEKSTVSFIIRKLAHFTEFFILGCLARKGALDKNDNRLLFIIFIVPIMDEFIQSFVPDRAMSIVDMGIDSIGIITGIALISLIHNYMSRKLIKND